MEVWLLPLETKDLTAEEDGGLADNGCLRDKRGREADSNSDLGSEDTNHLFRINKANGREQGHRVLLLLPTFNGCMLMVLWVIISTSVLRQRESKHAKREKGRGREGERVTKLQMKSKQPHLHTHSSAQTWPAVGSLLLLPRLLMPPPRPNYTSPRLGNIILIIILNARPW